MAPFVFTAILGAAGREPWCAWWLAC